MPRQARLDAPGTLHHVIGRGIEGSKIFRDPGDRKDFLDRIGSGGRRSRRGVEGKGSRSPDVVVKGIKERKGGGSEGARGDRRRSVVGARKVFCQLAVKRIGYSGAAVARFLGVTTSLVNRYASSEGVGILGRLPISCV